MKRDIIKIDESLCNGCGLCVPNCHEGALKIIDGKVRLVNELICDGLGACIGHCPEGAITIETREAEPFIEEGCPGSRTMVIKEPELQTFQAISSDMPSELRQWPVQMHLINPNAPYFKNADLILAADCVAFSMGNFHARYLKGKSLVIGCPKLDQGLDLYTDKLTALIDIARVNTITVMMMEVPCCGGLLKILRAAMAKSARKVPVKQILISISGEVLKDEWV